MDRKPVWTVWPPPSVPTLSSRSTEGSLPELVRNGPLAWMRTGRSSASLPFSCSRASTFRSALLMDWLKARSSRLSTFP